MRTFASLADQLAGHANSCIFSLVDPYAKVKKNLEIHRVAPITPAEIDRLARSFSTSAHAHGMALKTCAEDVDLDVYGIEHASCIDPVLISKLIGCDVSAPKDPNQRDLCGWTKRARSLMRKLDQACQVTDAEIGR